MNSVWLPHFVFGEALTIRIRCSYNLFGDLVVHLVVYLALCGISQSFEAVGEPRKNPQAINSTLRSAAVIWS